MIRGIYTGACGMLINEMRQGITANNLANIDTTGFKKDVAVFSMEPNNQIHRMNDKERIGKDRFVERSRYIGDMGTGSVIADMYVSKKEGDLKVTDNPTDMAITGDGSFSVETPDGVKFTRAGNFAVNREGFLVDANGNFVLGLDQTAAKELTPGTAIVEGVGYGRIKVDPQLPMSAGEDGVIYQANQFVSKLMIGKFQNSNQIVKSGTNLMGPVGENSVTIAGEVRVHGGALEASNVNAVYEMVNMIELQRSYEMNQKVILTHDEMLQKSINSVGRLTA